MTLKSLAKAVRLLRNPILWLPGLYGGVITAASLWLVFSGGEFIAGKLLFLGAVLFPLFIAGSLGAQTTGDYSLSSFWRSAVRFFFPVLLPVIIIIAIIILLLILFTIPFALAGFGNDPALIGGLCIGITVPVIIFCFFADNVAVSEGLKLFASLRQSMIIASRSVMTIISCMIISIFGAGALAMISATIWGMVLTDQFTPYLEMGMAEQQKVFSGFGLADWQRILGPDGIAATAVIAGIYLMIVLAVFIPYKQCCYEEAASVEPKSVPVTGEYDEKGRWYKY